MAGSENELQVRSFWEAVASQRWDAATELLSPGFVAEWPQSRERFNGREPYIAMNRAYPGSHRIEIVRLTGVGETVISEVRIITNEGEQDLFAISIFHLSNGKIDRATEYWADCCPAQEWRAKWVEQY